MNPTAGLVIPGPRLKEAQTGTRVDGYVTAATSCTFNIEERASATPNTAGTDMLTSDLVATVNGDSSTTFSNAGLAADCWITVAITTISGTPGTVQITLSTTVP
jgi:hypothetical protein